VQLHKFLASIQCSFKEGKSFRTCEIPLVKSGELTHQQASSWIGKLVEKKLLFKSKRGTYYYSDIEAVGNYIEKKNTTNTTESGVGAGRGDESHLFPINDDYYGESHSLNARAKILNENKGTLLMKLGDWNLSSPENHNVTYWKHYVSSNATELKIIIMTGPKLASMCVTAPKFLTKSRHWMEIFDDVERSIQETVKLLVDRYDLKLNLINISLKGHFAVPIHIDDYGRMKKLYTIGPDGVPQFPNKICWLDESGDFRKNVFGGHWETEQRTHAEAHIDNVNNAKEDRKKTAMLQDDQNRLDAQIELFANQIMEQRGSISQLVMSNLKLVEKMNTLLSKLNGEGEKAEVEQHIKEDDQDGFMYN